MFVVVVASSTSGCDGQWSVAVADGGSGKKMNGRSQSSAVVHRRRAQSDRYLVSSSLQSRRRRLSVQPSVEGRCLEALLLQVH